jgi:hypothetical protein
MLSRLMPTSWLGRKRDRKAKPVSRTQGQRTRRHCSSTSRPTVTGISEPSPGKWSVPGHRRAARMRGCVHASRRFGRNGWSRGATSCLWSIASPPNGCCANLPPTRHDMSYTTSMNTIISLLLHNFKIALLISFKLYSTLPQPNWFEKAPPMILLYRRTPQGLHFSKDVKFVDKISYASRRQSTAS